MRAFAITGIDTVSSISRIILIDAMRATPPSLRISLGTRSNAITAHAPAASAIFACSTLVTSMMTPPLSISASPVFSLKSSVKYMFLFSFPLHQRRRRLFAPRPIDPRTLTPEQLSQHLETPCDLRRLQARETQPQRTRVRQRNRKIFSWEKTHSLPSRARRQIDSVHPLRQIHPDIHPAFRTRELAAARKLRQTSFETSLQSLAAGRQHFPQMRLQSARLGEPQQHRLRKLIRMQIARLLG